MMTTIYQKIKKRIVFLDYKPGQVLTLRGLAKEFGVSVTPVREALIRLETDGLIRIVPNSSVYVTEVSFQKLRDVFEVRLFLMEKVGELAAQRVTSEELSWMKLLLEKMKKEKSHRNLVKLDSEFPNLVNEATKNETLVNVLEKLRDQVTRLWFFVGKPEEYAPKMAVDFGKLIEALEGRDVVASRMILRIHALDFIKQVKKEMFDEEINVRDLSFLSSNRSTDKIQQNL